MEDMCQTIDTINIAVDLPSDHWLRHQSCYFIPMNHEYFQ